MRTYQVTEGTQGVHRYWTGTVPVGDLVGSIMYPHDIPDLDEDEEMQRGYNKGRIKEMTNYVLNAEDHFYSAVTLLMIPRNIEDNLIEGDIEAGDDEFHYAFERAERRGPGKSRLGYMYLSGETVFFPGDGQHRLLSLEEAVKEDSAIAREEIPVVIIPFESPDQVRQLFADLNLNAKPISKTIGWAYDHRDPVAILAKKVASNVELFQGRVNMRSNSLPGSSTNVITLNTIVKANSYIVDGVVIRAAGLDVEDGEAVSREQKDAARSALLADVDHSLEQVQPVWETMISVFSEHWDTVIKGEPTGSRLSPAGELREQFLFPHGLGWLSLAKAAGRLIVDHGDDWAEHFTKAVESLDWSRNNPTWVGTAIVQGKRGPRVNNTNSAVEDVADVIVDKA